MASAPPASSTTTPIKGAHDDCFRCWRAQGLTAVALVVFFASSARAQIYETVGTRAQGMGGAFVAVADDATASWWNPAGLGSVYFSTVFERSTMTEPADTATDGPAWRGDTRAFAVSFPALGLSYYRLRISEIAPWPPAQAGEPAGRADPGAGGVVLRSLATSQYGATVAQSLGAHLVIGSTVKLVRAGLTTATAGFGGGSLDDAANLDVPLETHGDFDIGAMAVIERVRLGVSVKHVHEPAFGDEDSRFVLARQARAGFVFSTAAFSTEPRGTADSLTVAIDADLTRTATAFGDARHLAAGVEVSLLGRRLALRGGASTNTVGDGGSSASAGLGLALLTGVYLDGAATLGSDRSRKGWAIGLRLEV